MSHCRSHYGRPDDEVPDLFFWRRLLQTIFRSTFACSLVSGLQYGFYLVIIGAIIHLVGAGVELMAMRGSPAAAPPTPAAEMRPYEKM